MFQIEVLKNIKSNTQIRTINNNSCVITSINGPFQYKNQSECQLDIQIKLSIDKSLEYELKVLFEQIIILKEYPLSLIRIVCIPQVIEGDDLFCILFNSIYQGLLLQGIAMKKTCVGQQKEGNTIVFDALNNDIIYIKMDKGRKNINDLIEPCQEYNRQYCKWLRSLILCQQK